MSTTITLTRDKSLTRVGLPAARGQLRFGALRGGALRTTREVTARGVTTRGAMSTTYKPYDRDALTGQGRRSPSLEALLRFAATTTRHRSAARGAASSGLALTLPARLLEQEFGRGKVARFEDVDFPAPLTHEPTRRFLSGTGLPEDGFRFQLGTDIPLPTLAEYCADENPTVQLPEGAADLIRLGRLAEGNSLVLDGSTGAVLFWDEPEATLSPLNMDVSTLAFTLWLLHRAKRRDLGEAAGEAL